MVVITLVRHGNTDANNERWIQGQLDTELNERGHGQAQCVAERLKSSSFHHIYCSDLRRCRQTASAIHAHHRDVPIEYVPGLREYNFGSLAGLPIHEFSALRAQQDEDIDTLIKNAGGETTSEFETRVITTYERIVTEAMKYEENRHILIVTHGGPLKLLGRWWVAGKAAYRIADNSSFHSGNYGNTGVSQVNVEAGHDGVQGIIQLYNCTAHLTLDNDTAPPAV